MAPPPGTLRVGRYFLALFALMVLLYLLVFLPGEKHTPKLGLDLVGGQQVIFQAKAPHGQTPSTSSMEQAKQIIEDRVNGSGVTEATVVIQGADQLIVSIPGGTKTDVSKLGAAAVLNFRGVIAPAAPVTCVSKSAASSSASPSSTPSASKSSGASPHAAGERPLTAPTTPAAKSSPTPATSSGAGKSGATTSAATPSGSTSPSAPAATSQAAKPCTLKSVAQLEKAVKLPAPGSVYATNGLSATLAQQVQAQLTNFDCASNQNEPDIKSNYYLACDKSGLAFLLGPVIVPGNQIDTASAVAPNLSGNGGGSSQWTVSLNLKSSGSDAWGKYTGAHNIGGSSATSVPSVTQCSPSATACANYVAFTLDGNVLSYPVNESAINGQATQISGSFTQQSATDLADQLKYGALPLSFTSQQAQTVSATLGTSQLKAGLLAGGIGLALVVIYSLIYYRALGLVTIASLIVSGGLTYASLVVLGTQIGFTLSLAGIAGFIVAVGITADSFVVFFERIKDEVHDGRSLRVAVPRAWVRARRTILSADTVSFLAAAILYYFAAGDVKGFAFTLGLSTILDLVIVFLFTHPLVSVLSRSRAFGSPRFTGLNAVRAGGIVADAAAPSARAPRSRPATRAQATKAATAVLEEPSTRTTDDETATADVLAVDGEDVVDESIDLDEPIAEPAEVLDDEQRERRRTTPEPGSAAERAAARRARMREQRGAEPAPPERPDAGGSNGRRPNKRGGR